MTRVATYVGILCACLPGLVRADALIQTLPSDGSWVSFQATIKSGDQEEKSLWTVRSVGKKVVDNEPCRWIEFQARDENKTIVFKLLIAEKEFGVGKNPVRKAKLVWSRILDDEPRQVASMAEADPVLAIVLDGPTADVKKREKKEAIQWQNGAFESDVFEGKNSQELFGNKVELLHTVWKHPDVPFGITAMKQSFELKIGDDRRLNSLDMTLKEFGNGAKSDLPDVK